MSQLDEPMNPLHLSKEALLECSMRTKELISRAVSKREKEIADEVEKLRISRIRISRKIETDSIVFHDVYPDEVSTNSMVDEVLQIILNK